MITMALLALFGLAAVVLLYFTFTARAASQRAAVQMDLEAAVTLKLRQAQEADAELVRQVVDGASVDQALTQYQRVRTGILASDRPEDPWLWNGDDLESWRKRESHRRMEDVNRRTLVPAIGSSLVIIMLTATSIAITYHFLAAQSGDVSSSSFPGKTTESPNVPPVILPPSTTHGSPEPPVPVDPDNPLPSTAPGKTAPAP